MAFAPTTFSDAAEVSSSSAKASSVPSVAATRCASTAAGVRTWAAELV